MRKKMPEGTKKITTTVCLHQWQKKAIDEISEKSGKTISAIFMDALCKVHKIKEPQGQ